MSGNQYPNDVQFAGLIQAATAAADAQERNASVLGKRQRAPDDNLIDTQLRATPNPIQANTGQLPSNPPTLQNAASVLFREPTAKSGKYSRPPLATVYRGLELAPESFLRLQNAAKVYMLDDDHAERRDVVGHKKHSSVNDVAKLRLWSCVNDFLNADNNGERWFGHNAGIGVADTPPRTVFWPEDRDKIIKACLPLFRKTVTNERQRVYASVVRKDPAKSGKSKDPDTIAQVGDATQAQTMDKESPMIDLTLDDTSVGPNTSLSNGQQQQSEEHAGSLMLHVNVVHNVNGTCHRAIPRFTITANATPTLSALLGEARTKHDIVQINTDANWLAPTIKVWLPDGLVRIRDDAQWMAALIGGSMVEWMDSEVRVIIDIGESPTDLLAVD